VDLEREVDLIEEVCRIHGVEKIPPECSRRSPPCRDSTHNGMPACGYDRSWLRLVSRGAEPNASQPRRPEIAESIDRDQQALRSSLVPGLLANLRTNVSRHQYDVRLFEMGGCSRGWKESLRLALAVTAGGNRVPGRRVYEMRSWITTM